MICSVLPSNVTFFSFTNVSEDLAAIALMMEAAWSSETLLNFYQTTRRYNPEDSHLRTHHLENLKFYLISSLRAVSVVCVRLTMERTPPRSAECHFIGECLLCRSFA
jgi:hypothetical protein